jgi:hypothetical protein
MAKIDMLLTDYVEQNKTHLKVLDVLGDSIPALDEMRDSQGIYLAIPCTDDSLSAICGTFVGKRLIRQIDYDKFLDGATLMKAYY